MKNYRLDGWGRGYIEQWRKKKKKNCTDRFELVLKFYTMEIFAVSARITKIWIYCS